ncbi:MAG: type II secretion system protein GspK [Tepidisphaeraceae bacterium]|jgi:type II secretory pathway component PulK
MRNWNPQHRPSRRQNRRGAIFITAMGIIVILGGLLIVFAQKMRAEALASANRLAYDQADAIEQGAEQWVLAQTEEYTQDAVTLCNDIPTQGIQVGQGYFWIIRPNQDSNQNFDFGLVDESGKLNLNSATSDELQILPNMTPALADAIVDWRTPEANGTPDGAKTPTYQALPEPYACKDSNYETVDELRLISGMTPQILYGQDTNRNGVIDPGEQAAQSAATNGINLNFSSGGTDMDRGIINFVTAYSQQSQSRTVNGRRVTTLATGLINVNTAPEQVLMCLPGITQQQAETLIGTRQGGTTSGDTSWIRGALGAAAYNQISTLITTTSYQYSADIVAVSGDGRAFKRVQIVVDCRQTPAKIIYRKDLTDLGWPLPREIKDSLRKGQGVPSEYGGDSATLTGGNPLNP